MSVETAAATEDARLLAEVPGLKKMQLNRLRRICAAAPVPQSTSTEVQTIPQTTAQAAPVVAFEGSSAAMTNGSTSIAAALAINHAQRPTLQVQPPEQRPDRGSKSSNSSRELLTRVGLGNFADTFDTMELWSLPQLAQVSEEKLLECGMKKVHIKRVSSEL